jgi:hypothetical protein
VFLGGVLVDSTRNNLQGVFMSTPYTDLAFSRSLTRLSLLIALSASTTAMAENIDSTAAFYGQSNPGVFVTNPAETLGYIAEGASLTIVELPDGAGSTAGVMPVVAQVPVDGSIMGFEVGPDGDTLYVAGGSFGLLKVDIADGNSADCDAQDMGAVDGCYRVSTLDDVDQDTGEPSDRWVFDVAVMDHPDGPLVLAPFAAKGQNELRVYSANAARLGSTSLNPTARIKLPGNTRDSDGNPVRGVAYDLEVDGTDVYVAMGVQGVVKVDLSDLTRPRRFKGPVLDGPGEAQFDQPALVRQVTVGGDTLLGAANGAGLLEIDLAQPFNRNMTYATYPLSDPEEADEPAYAARIDAIDYRSDSWVVAVSTVKSPVQNVEGAPGEPSGTLSFNLIPGGWLGEYDQGSNEGIYLLTPRPDGSLLEIPVSLSARRSVRLGDASGTMRLYVGDRKSTSVRAADYGAPLIAERVREDRWGKNAPRVGPTLIDLARAPGSGQSGLADAARAEQRGDRLRSRRPCVDSVEDRISPHQCHRAPGEVRRAVRTGGRSRASRRARLL